MLPSRLWTELTTTDFATVDMAAYIAVLPVAAIEQHGAHLPLGTDTFIMEGYLDRVRARLPAEARIIFLPLQSLGCSIEHSGFAGTLSLTAAEALVAWSGIVEAVVRTGCRKIVIVNSHGGNSAIVDILARDMRAHHGALVVLASWQRFGYPDGLFSNGERTHGIHGGDIETSLMLSFRPDLVRMDQAKDVISTSVAIEKDHAWLRVGRPTGIGWMAEDLSEEGTVGNSAQASAAKGEACAAYGAAAFIALLGEVGAFDLAKVGARSSNL